MSDSRGRPAVVEARGLTRDYAFGKEVVHALCGVTFDVPAGDYVVRAHRTGFAASKGRSSSRPQASSRSGRVVSAARFWSRINDA